MRLSFARRSSVSPSSDAAMRAVADPAWAGVRYDAASASTGHVESWFLKANDPTARRALWLKWTIWAGDRSPRRAIAEAWAIAFGTEHGHVATKTAVPFEQARFATGTLGAEVDGSTLAATRAHGRVESGGRSIAFDLAIESREAPLLPYPAKWMYTGPVPSQKLVSPVPNARISGEAIVDGETWKLDAWPGMVGHNWGRRHSELYAWGHCNSWDDEEDVVLEGVTARVRVGGVLAPAATLVCVRHHGTSYMASSPASIARNVGQVSPRRWRFHAKASRLEVDGEMWADTEDFVGLFYPNPDGSTCHCLNSKLAHAEVTVRLAGRAPRVLRSRAAALEIGTVATDHGVKMYV
jgi:hypothetical protein